MPLIDFRQLDYLPILGTKPAEMEALQELPDSDKDKLTPIIELGPWVAARMLSSSVSRIQVAFGDRPKILNLADFDPPVTPRPVHSELQLLRNPTNGFANWHTFISGLPDVTPCVLLDCPPEIPAQLRRFRDLGRGIVVRVERPALSNVPDLARVVNSVFVNGSGVCFVLDFGRADRNILGNAMMAIEYVQQVQAILPEARISVSASSFPDSFTGVSQQNIFERDFFRLVNQRCGEKLVYSDRGSVRAEALFGGSGAPAPRIDLALPTVWSFFRSDDVDGAPGYFAEAKSAINSAHWDSRLRIWGTQMIERAAANDPSSITSSRRSTAVRINLHLHQQIHFGDPAGLYDTDDEWKD